MRHIDHQKTIFNQVEKGLALMGLYCLLGYQAEAPDRVLEMARIAHVGLLLEDQEA